jgi:alanine racemase
MEYLEESADMSTITAHISTQESELPVLEKQWKPFQIAKNALRSTISFWQNLGSAVIWLLIFASPFALVTGIVFLLRKPKK